MSRHRGGGRRDTTGGHRGAAHPSGGPGRPDLRILAVATLVNAFGNGALMTTFALYFTHVVGLSATQVGVALSVATGRPARAGAPRTPRGPPRAERSPAVADLGGRGRHPRPPAHRQHRAPVSCPRGRGVLRPRIERGPQRHHRPGRGRRPRGALQGLPAGGHQPRHLLGRCARGCGSLGRPALGVPRRLRPQRRELCRLVSPVAWPALPAAGTRAGRGRVTPAGGA